MLLVLCLGMCNELVTRLGVCGVVIMFDWLLGVSGMVILWGWLLGLGGLTKLLDSIMLWGWSSILHDKFVYNLLMLVLPLTIRLPSKLSNRNNSIRRRLLVDAIVSNTSGGLGSIVTCWTVVWHDHSSASPQ